MPRAKSNHGINKSSISCSSAYYFEYYIITDENFKNETFTLKGIFLYTEEDKDLVKYVRENYESLDRLTGEWCDVYVFEKPCPSFRSFKKYWLSLLKAELYEKWSVYRWITATKPFDKNESYKIAEKLAVSPIHFPCLVLLPPSNELSSEEKLIIPIKEASKQYFRQLFHLLKNIIDYSEKIDKYEAVKINFKNIVKYLEENSERVSQQTTTKYQIQGTNIFVNNKLEKLKMNNKNVEVEMNISGGNNTGVAGKVAGNQNVYASEQKQTLAEAAEEIQQLLEQLSQTYPTNTTTEQMVVATEAIKRIESNPSFKQRVINAAREGGLAAFEKALDSTAGAFITGAVRGWLEAEA